MFKPMRFYLTPASIPQVVAYIQKYLEENPIVSPETVQEIIRIAIQEDPDLFNGSIIPIDGTSEQSIKDYIDSLPTVDAYTKAQINSMLAAKQDNLTFDTVPTADSLNPVTSGGIDTALDLKADKADTYTKTQTDTALDLKADKADTYTKTQTDNLLILKADKADTYTKAAIDNLLDTKQGLLTFDATPTHDSTNPVTSNGILNSLTTLNENIGEQIALKANTSDMNAALAQKQNVLTFDTAPTYGSLNPITSDGIFKSEYFEPGETYVITGNNILNARSWGGLVVINIPLPKRIDSAHVSSVSYTPAGSQYYFTTDTGPSGFNLTMQDGRIEFTNGVPIVDLIISMSANNLPGGINSVMCNGTFTFNA